ncbi:MAG TPA: hypothetical protein GX699_02255 [Firmicutes bacterium]|nr:hypothetical protein [Bacillota bacterium]
MTARFADYVLNDNKTHGMYLRYSFPPHPVGFVPRETIREYLRGTDPVTGKPLVREIIEALTKPLTEEEKNPVLITKPKHPRLLPPDTEENLHRLFLKSGWTDGLPIVLPTEERVAEMLTGTDADPNQVVGTMSIGYYEEKLEYTAEQVAVNAVMAGARPEHLPVILAIAATQRPSLPSSTTSFASMVVVNGPVRDLTGMNYGTGALSPFNYANSVIGRTWTLMSKNFGDARLGETFMASTGHNLNYNNMCFAENEADSPYEPLHVEKGFRAEENTVSLFRGWNVLGLGLGPAERMAEVLKFLPTMGKVATFVMDPLVAKNLKTEGFTTKTKLREYLAERRAVCRSSSTLS